MTRFILSTEALTFTARHSIVPHHVAIFEDAGDGLGAMGLHKTLLTQERDRTT